MYTKVGSITVPTSTGNQAITGVGFQPKVVLFWTTETAADGNEVNLRLSWGVAVSSTERWTSGIGATDGAVTSGRVFKTTKCLSVVDATPTVQIEADLVTMDSDGFTINWTTVQASSRQVFYMAIGGSEISAKAGYWDTAASTGNQAITGVGFQPDLLLFAQALDNTTEPGANYIWWEASMAKSSSSRGLLALTGSGDGITIESKSALITSKILRNIYAGTTYTEADFVSMDADGFTINNSTVTQKPRVGYLALRGALSKIGTFVENTTTGNQSITGVGFQPQAVLFLSQSKATGTTNTASARAAIGAATSSSARWGIASDRTEANPYLSDRRTQSSKVLTHLSAGTPTVDAEADFVSNDSDGFTINMTTADATARDVLYLALTSVTLSLSVSDSITVSESYSLSGLGSGVTLQANVSDSITLTESIGRLLTSFVNKSDSIIVKETVSYPFDRAIYFNGSSDYLTASMAPATTGFDIAFWLNVEALGNNEYLFDVTGGSNHGFRFIRSAGVNVNNLYFQVFNAGSNVAQIVYTSVSAFKPMHVVATFAPNSAKLYVDKVLIGTDTSCTIGTFDGTFTIGRTVGGSNYMKMALDRMVWKNTATPWTQSDINDLYDFGTIPSGASYWDFNNSLTDLSGNGETLTVGSGTSYIASPMATISVIQDYAINVSDSITVSENKSLLISFNINKNEKIVLSEGLSYDFKKGLNLNGTSDYVTASIVPDVTNGFSFAIFYRPSDPYNNQENILSWMSSSDRNGFQLRHYGPGISGDRQIMYVGANASTAGVIMFGGNNIERDEVGGGRPIFIAVTYIPSRTRLYMDGVLGNSSSAFTLTSNVNPLTLGRLAYSSGGFLNGTVDMLVWKNGTEWTQTDITNLFQSQTIPTGSSWWDFNDNVTDQSGNGETITLNGTTYADNVFTNLFVQGVFQVNVSDSVAITENTGFLEESYVNKSESITLTESTTVQIPATGGLSINSSDSITVTDSLGFALDFAGSNSYMSLGTLGSFGSNLASGIYFKFDIQTTQTSKATFGFGQAGKQIVKLTLNGNASEAEVNHAINTVIRNKTATKLFRAAAVSPTINFNDGSRHEIKMYVYPASNLVEIYIDNVSQTITYNEQQTPVEFEDLAANPFCVGAISYGGTILEYLDGTIDNFQIGISPSNLYGSYSLNEGYGITAYDSSGNGNNGTLLGSSLPTWVNRISQSTEFVQLLSYVDAFEDITVSDIPRYWQDTVYVSESYNVEIVTPNTLFKSVSDSITVTENTIVRLLSFVDKSESITLSESISVKDLIAISTSDSISISESKNLHEISYVVESESISVSENKNVAHTFTIQKSESITLSESIGTNPLLYITESESITISENLITRLDILIKLDITTILSDDLSSTPTGTLSGTALYDSVNDWVTLIAGQTNSTGTLQYSNSILRTNSFITTFDWYRSGSADGTYFFWGSTSLNSGGYSVWLDFYNNRIVLFFNGSVVDIQTPITMPNAAFVQVAIKVKYLTTGTQIDVKVNGQTRFNYTDIVRTQNGNAYGWSAFNGGQTSTQRIDNLLIEDISRVEEVWITETTNFHTNSSINKSESISISENKTLNLTSFISRSESISVSENVIVRLFNFVNTSENITIEERPALAFSGSINSADFITVQENTALILEIKISTSEEISVSELIGVQRIFCITLSEEISVNEDLEFFILPIPHGVDVDHGVGENTQIVDVEVEDRNLFRNVRILSDNKIDVINVKLTG